MADTNHVILEREFETPVTLADVRDMAGAAMSCMQIYSVEWQSSHLARDGNRLYCHFKAPDTEALRSVMRTVGSTYRAVWPGEVISAASQGQASVMVERSWRAPVAFEAIARIEEDHAWCLDAHRVTFLKSYFSRDRMRMLCVYAAPDAESVRRSQIQAGMPFDQVWPFVHITPALLMGEAG